MTEQDYAAKVRALTEAAEDAIALLSAYFLDGPPEEPDSTIRALERARDALLDAPAPSEPGLDEETLARAIHGFHSDYHGGEPDETDRRLAASFAAEYARLRGGQE